MTQEQKELLLKDLCGRLPHGVKVNNEIQGDFEIYGICENIVFGRNEVCHIDFDVEKIKPYLFPLSSMTDEQEKDIFHNGKFYIDHHNSICRFPTNEDDYDFVTVEDCLEIFNKLNKYHFDYRGLIPMGLALDATGLNIY
jgi:hypothetical protein